MKYVGITCWNIVFFLTVCCSGYTTQPEQHAAGSVEATDVRGAQDREPGSSRMETRGCIPGQVIVKFKEGTGQQTIEAIQRELHLKIIRVVSRPNLYLMEVEEGSSLEEITRRLQDFKAVEYAEPNYVRRIQ
ncbi:MAG: hypothetical protein JW883_06925 [Deltaproteobacteria bacterium]|nr:hypothetical protein [Deltaproteobacteria bacterium]